LGELGTLIASPADFVWNISNKPAVELRRAIVPLDPGDPAVLASGDLGFNRSVTLLKGEGLSTGGSGNSNSITRK